MNETEEAERVAIQLWKFFHEGKWDDAKELLDEGFEAVWPQSKEKIVGPDHFIEPNRKYPWEAQD